MYKYSRCSRYSNKGGVGHEKNSIGNNRAHCISRNWSSKCYINNDVMVG
nr:MAG TPA: hypothetical protein [Caudoviricetes sp.]